MLLALPADAALCQHVVVAADAQADAAVLLIGKPRVFQRVEAVSYTHLDVYKRQSGGSVPAHKKQNRPHHCPPDEMCIRDRQYGVE